MLAFSINHYGLSFRATQSVELFCAYNLRAAVTFNYFEAYMVLMLLYWVIILILERFETVIEKYFEKTRTR